jgi:hypothetical protein
MSALFGAYSKEVRFNVSFKESLSQYKIMVSDI